MIIYVYVDGFRSLSNFELETKTGLNILVGPNGSGKSNVISFFQFISRIMTSDLGDAVSLSGGVGAFFQKVGQQSFRNEVSVLLRGITYTFDRDLTGERSREGYWAQYQYSFTIQASERFDSIVFSSQALLLKRLHSDRREIPRYLILDDDSAWDIALKSTAFPNTTDVLELKDDRIPVLKFRRPDKPLEIRSMLEEMLRIEGTGLQSNSLVSVAARPIELAAEIVNDLRGGETLNINPSKVKEPEDSARTPGIRSDGSGLAATIWHMTNEPRPVRSPRLSAYYPILRRVRSFWPIEVHSQFQAMMKLINEQIEQVTVENDRFDNQLKVKVRMRLQENDVDLPLSAMSDGTIKWMSLITAILTSGKIFAIEEPENFLHPLMLVEILKLMRTTTSDKYSFAIMTTHSETLLNAARPDEIVVVSMSEGVTRGRRPSDPNHLEREIQETGFGLGHYYLIGVVDDA